jgi:2-C-methyl-D-erythritol 4-phosphate cytidylyltransferase
MRKVVIIVAAGSGSRMQSELPKQFIELNGLPVLMHTINKFYEFDSHIEIRLVLPDDHVKHWLQICERFIFPIRHEIFSGGSNRFFSVKNGLQDIGEDAIVAIHDGVRPLVSLETINRGFKLAAKKGTAIPVVDVHETIRHLSQSVSKTVPRVDYRLVQTPQVFKSSILAKAYNQEFHSSFTDDASVVENMGIEVSLYEGNRENLKITTPNDLVVASAYLNHNS